MNEGFHPKKEIFTNLFKKFSPLRIAPYAFPAFLNTAFLEDLVNNPSPGTNAGLMGAIVGGGVGFSIGTGIGLLLFEGDDDPVTRTLQTYFSAWGTIAGALLGWVGGSALK